MREEIASRRVPLELLSYAPSKRVTDRLAECSVYVYTAPDGAVMYVGVSGDVAKRSKQHEARPDFDASKCNCDVIVTNSRRHALDAETLLIRLLRPRFNVAKADKFGMFGGDE